MSTESTEIKADNGSKVLEETENVLKKATEVTDGKTDNGTKMLDQSENGTKRLNGPGEKLRKLRLWFHSWAKITSECKGQIELDERKERKKSAEKGKDHRKAIKSQTSERSANKRKER